MPRSLRARFAFTLIELLVAISVIAVLVAMLIPSLSGARTVALKVSCASTMRQIGLGTAAYRTDNRDYIFLTAKIGNGANSYIPFGLSANTPYSTTFEEYWAKGLRHCPSVSKLPEAVGTYDGDLPKRSFQWNYASPLLENLYGAAGGGLTGVYPADSFMEDRVAPAGAARAYVRIAPGAAFYKGATFTYFGNGKRFDPTRSMPLFADYLCGSNGSSPFTYTLSPHNGANAVMNTVNNIDSQGANSLWEDYHVEWHAWPDAAKNPPAPISYASQADGIFGDVQSLASLPAGTNPEAWALSGGWHYYYFWCKPDGF